MSRAWAVIISLASTLAAAEAVVSPPSLLQPSPAAWPQDGGAGGDVELLLTIDDTGGVRDIEVQSSPGDAFTDSAISAARGLVFKPATLDGGAVGVVLAYRYHFEPLAFDAGLPPGRLVGTVMTKGTRDVIPLAHVSFGDAGIETDGEGRFELELAPGPLELHVNASGHVERVFKENVSAGQRVEVLYRIERTYSRPYETVVRGQTDRAEVSRITLSGAEIHEVAGTAGDPLRVVMLLPGVTTTVSGLSYPVVRGSLPAATGFFLDGVRVPQLYHLLALNPVIHPDFIESIDFYAANAPTRYGRVSGGVIGVQVKKPRDDRVHFTIAPDLLQTNAFLEVPIPSTGTNVTLGGSVNYAGWILGTLAAAGVFPPGAQPVAESWDYQARLEQKFGKGSVRLLAFGSSDQVGIRPRDDGTVTLLATSRFHRVDLRAQYPVGPGFLEVGSYLGWETVGAELKQQGTGGEFTLERFTWAARTSYRIEFGPHFQLKAGFDIERQHSDVTTTLGPANEANPLRQPNVMGVFTGSFLEAAFFASQWSIVAGVRVDTWHLPPDLTLISADPRLDVRFKASESLTLRASAGMAHQAPMLLISLPVSDTAALSTGLQEVGQFSLGAVGLLPWFGLEVSGDVFYNHIFQARERSITEFITGISTVDDRISGNRWGRAYGAELMVRLPQQGRLFGWLSYTLMRSERLRRFALFNADQTFASTTTALLPFAFDQTHSLNLTLGYQFTRGWKLGASFHLNTGRPESGEFGTRTQRVVENPGTGEQRWAPVSLNEVGRLPTFARLDVRASKTITFSTFSAEIYLDIMNVLVRPEVHGFDYGFGMNGLPLKVEFGIPAVLPTLGVKVVY